MNLGTAWGMAVAGGVLRLLGRSEAVIHYPTVFVLLPSLATVVEWSLYTVAGSVLVPAMLIRIEGFVEGGSTPDAGRRIRRAILPTLVAGALSVALLGVWDWALTQAVAPSLQSRFPGAQGLLGSWAVGVAVSIVVTAAFVYVPIRAIRPNEPLGAALLGGIRDGLRLLWPTFGIILVCSLPALLVAAGAQVNPSVIVRKMRPELVAYLLMAYACLTSIATYLIYAAASRLHWAPRRA